jgi:hypothetical protein
MESDILFGREIDQLFNDALHQSFPGIHLDGNSQAGPQFSTRLYNENRHFENTEYFYKGELNFIHFTSIDKLWSILNSRTFRLYNLNSSDDPDEYGYAARILGWPDTRIEIGKKYTYTISFCQAAELKNELLWNKYGQQGAGAAILFSIDGDPRDWENFNMAEMQYDTPASFVKYREMAAVVEQTKGVQLWCDLSQFIGFHKVPSFEGEREVRLLTYFPYRHEEEYWKYAKTEFRIDRATGRNRVTQYIELPLWVDNDSSYVKCADHPELDRTLNLPKDYFATRPKIRIRNIVFGPQIGISPYEFGEYRREIVEAIRNNFGYEVDIEQNLVPL